MKTNEKISVIKSVFKEVAKYNLHYRYRVNSGGCGVFADIVKDYFPTLDIIYLDPTDEIDIYMGRPSSCSHVVLKDKKGNLYDCNGVLDKSKTLAKYGNYFEEVTREYLQSSLEVDYLWNDEFDKYLEGEIREAFEQAYNYIIKNESRKSKSGSSKAL